MDAEHFEKRLMEKLVPNIPENSIIIMDNAQYHSVVLDKAPTSNTWKSIMQQWLTDKEVEWDPTMLKPELYDLVKQANPLYIQYKIDTWAAEMGHRVIRLPPYHCELNPIGLIWAISPVIIDNHETLMIALGQQCYCPLNFRLCNWVCPIMCTLLAGHFLCSHATCQSPLINKS